MGRIQTGSYKNRNGETVYTTDVVADRVEFLGGSNQQQSQPQVNTDEVQRQADELLRPRPQQNTQMKMESQFNGFDDLPDTFMAAEDDIPFRL